MGVSRRSIDVLRATWRRRRGLERRSNPDLGQSGQAGSGTWGSSEGSDGSRGKESRPRCGSFTRRTIARISAISPCNAAIQSACVSWGTSVGTPQNGQAVTLIFLVEPSRRITRRVTRPRARTAPRRRLWSGHGSAACSSRGTPPQLDGSVTSDYMRWFSDDIWWPRHPTRTLRRRTTHCARAQACLARTKSCR